MLGAPLVPWSVCLGAGIGLAELGVGPIAGACLAGVSLSLLVCALRRARGVMIASWLVASSLGVVLGAHDRTAPFPPLGCAEGASVWRATVDGPIEQTPLDGRPRQRTVIRLEGVRCGQQIFPRQGRALVTLHGAPAVRRGDELEVKLDVFALGTSRGPAEQDPLHAGRRDGLTARAVVRSPHALLQTPTSAPSSLRATLAHRWRRLLGLVDDARLAAARTFDGRLPQSASTLAKALAMGDRAAMSAEDRERWADAGLSHLLAVSGMHVSMVGLLLFFLVRWGLASIPGLVERHSAPRLAALAAIPAVVVFCVFSAAPASAARASIMAVVLLAGAFLRRPGGLANALGLSVASMLLWTPASLFDPGFLLSVAAVTALLVLPRRPRPARGAARLVASVRDAVMTSFAATVGTAPITALEFGRVCLIAPLTNLVAVPLGATLGTPLTLALLAFEPLGRAPSELIAGVLTWLTEALAAVARLGAALPLASLGVPKPNVVELAAYLGLALALARLGGAARRLMAGVAALALLLSAGWRCAAWFGRSTLSVQHLYVGQGDAAVVLLPGGETWLIDGGGAVDAAMPDPGRLLVAPHLRQLGVRTIDVMAATHAHPDHVRGLLYVAEHFAVRELWLSGAGDEVPEQRQLEALVRARGGLVRRARDLPPRARRRGVEVEVLHPLPGQGEAAYGELGLNDNSLVLRLSHVGVSVLFAGDIEALAESLLAGEQLRSDVLKVPHHGSRTSSTADLLDAVLPTWAVISCGERNRFGFPHAEVLARYARHGVRVLRTDLHGMITLSSARGGWRVATWRGGNVSR